MKLDDSNFPLVKVDDKPILIIRGAPKLAGGERNVRLSKVPLVCGHFAYFKRDVAIPKEARCIECYNQGNPI